MPDSEKAKFDGLLQRVRSALILLPIVIVPVVLGGFWFAALLALVGFLMAREWAGLLKASPSGGIALGGITIALFVFGWAVGAAEAIALLLVILLAAMSVVFWLGRRLTPFCGGLVYVSLPLLAAQYFREDALGMLIIGYVLLSVWAVDIFAMFVGKMIGGPKLAPRLSPGKTWAGLFGAIAGAMLAGVLSFLVIVGFGFGDASFTALMVIAPALALCAQSADLFESGIKRKYGIKDSGAIIPGHGGLLDRVDGLVGVLIALLFLSFMRGGTVSAALWIW